MADRCKLVLHHETKEIQALEGLYDYTFEWPGAGSSLFDSVAQLGLKLEAKKEPVEILVIDHAEHRSAN